MEAYLLGDDELGVVGCTEVCSFSDEPDTHEHVHVFGCEAYAVHVRLAAEVDSNCIWLIMVRQQYNR